MELRAHLRSTRGGDACAFHLHATHPHPHPHPNSGGRRGHTHTHTHTHSLTHTHSNRNTNKLKLTRSWRSKSTNLDTSHSTTIYLLYSIHGCLSPPSHLAPQSSLEFFFALLNRTPPRLVPVDPFNLQPFDENHLEDRRVHKASQSSVLPKALKLSSSDWSMASLRFQNSISTFQPRCCSRVGPADHQVPRSWSPISFLHYKLYIHIFLNHDLSSSTSWFVSFPSPPPLFFFFFLLNDIASLKGS